MDVNSIIDNLAIKFGTTVPYLIGEMRKYYIVESLMWTLIFILFTIGMFFVARFLLKKSNDMKQKNEWDDWEMPMVFGYVSFVASFILLCLSLVNLISFLQWCISPTASALAEVLKMVSR